MATNEIETMAKAASGCARRIRSLINKMPYVAPELAPERFAMMIQDLDALETQLRGIITVCDEESEFEDESIRLRMGEEHYAKLMTAAHVRGIVKPKEEL